MGSYAYLDAFLLEETTGGAVGNRLVGVPEHSGRLWIHHDLQPAHLKGWSVGAGVYAATSQAIEIGNNIFPTPTSRSTRDLATTPRSFQPTCRSRI